jgi:hypothetical protein
MRRIAVPRNKLAFNVTAMALINKQSREKVVPTEPQAGPA